MPRALAPAGRWAARVAVAIGVVAAATMLATSVLWWASGDAHNAVWRAAGRMVGINPFWQQSTIIEHSRPDGNGFSLEQIYFMDWPVVALLAGATAAFAVPLALVAVRARSPLLRAAIASWTLPAAIAAAYASTLPLAEGSPFELGSAGGSDIRWPLLALGIQIATVIPLAAWWSLREIRTGRRRLGVAAAVGCVAAAAVAAVLIAKGVVWIDWVGGPFQRG